MDTWGITFLLVKLSRPTNRVLLITKPHLLRQLDDYGDSARLDIEHVGLQIFVTTY